MCTGFYGVRPRPVPVWPPIVLTTSRKSSRGCSRVVGAAQRSVQMAPNFAGMWRRARRTHTDILDRIWDFMSLPHSAVDPCIGRHNDNLSHLPVCKDDHPGIRIEGGIHRQPWRRPAMWSAAAGLGVDPYNDMYNNSYNDNNNELETTMTITINQNKIQWQITITITTNQAYNDNDNA